MNKKKKNKEKKQGKADNHSLIYLAEWYIMNPLHGRVHRTKKMKKEKEHSETSSLLMEIVQKDTVSMHI